MLTNAQWAAWCTEPVEDIDRRSCDAYYILEAPEFDWPWLFGTVPVEVLPVVDETAEDHCRMPPIQAWIEECGGVDKALRASPPLVIVRSGVPEVLDGYHRLKLARQAGLQLIPVLVALREKV